jgi:TIR domain
MAGNRRGHDPVADIFISYSKKDDPDARLLSVFLELKGTRLGGMPTLEGGDKYRATITAELNKARAVIVIWTKNSSAPTGSNQRLGGH